MNVLLFEKTLKNYQAIVREFGKDSFEAESALAAFEQSYGNCELQTEHWDILVKLNVIPNYTIGIAGKPYFSQEAIACHQDRLREEVKRDLQFKNATNFFDQVVGHYGIDSLEARRSYLKIINFARDDEEKSACLAYAAKNLGFPVTVGYSDKGEPIIDIESCAKFLDMDVDDFISSMGIYFAENGHEIPIADSFNSIN